MLMAVWLPASSTFPPTPVDGAIGRLKHFCHSLALIRSSRYQRFAQRMYHLLLTIFFRARSPAAQCDPGEARPSEFAIRHVPH